MKAFILGCIVGISATLIVLAAIEPDRQRAASPSETLVTALSPPQEITREPERIGTLSADPSTASGQPPSVEDCIAMLNRDARRADRILASEPKDSAWSAASEQQISHFIASQPSARHFQIVSIDCRTSFCEVNAVGGPGELSVRSFQEVLEKLRTQFDFRPGASEASDDGTRAVMRQRLMRA